VAVRITSVVGRSLRRGIAVIGLVACASRTPSDADAAERALLAEVQRVGCVRPAETTTCEERREVFVAETRPSYVKLSETEFDLVSPKLSVRCEHGWPRGTFPESGGRRPRERDIPMSHWEAIWRVLDATHDCASSYGVSVIVVRDGVRRTCPHPKIDMRAIFDMARDAPQPSAQTRRPIARDLREYLELVCANDPTSCSKIGNAKCPPFLGAWWPPESVYPGPAETASPETSALPDEVDAGTPRDERVKPSPSAVTTALAAAMGNARRCVGDEAQSVRVSITFAPNGEVADVALVGRASSAKTLGCFRAAFATAHVPPFDGPYYPVSVTVRPTP
jgi:hypothetical protein